MMIKKVFFGIACAQMLSAMEHPAKRIHVDHSELVEALNALYSAHINVIAQRRPVSRRAPLAPIEERIAQFEACKNNVKELLETHDKTPLNNFLIGRINQGTVGVRLAIDLGADVNICNEAGRSPLMMMIEYGDSALVRLLIRAGADIIQRDNNGFTALDIARQILAVNPATQPIVDLLQNALEGRNIE